MVSTSMPEASFRVLYFSSAPVSPNSGGGQTIYNLLEPSAGNSEVYYAVPAVSPVRDVWKTPFPEIRSRVVYYSLANPLPFVGGWKRSRLANKINSLCTAANRAIQDYLVARQIEKYIQDMKIDVMLAYLVTLRDVRTVAILLKRRRIPVITWFMDDYFTNHPLSFTSVMSGVWCNSYQNYVISEAMRHRYQGIYGRDCQVLNNSVPFSDRHPEFERNSNSRLRIAYAGSIYEYYREPINAVFRALSDLPPHITLDIYTHDADRSTIGPLPDGVQVFSYLPADQLRAQLEAYDLLLMLSNFEPKWRFLAETSLSCKTADYLRAGRCILVYGPAYAENVRYARRYGYAEVVTSSKPGELQKAVMRLTGDPVRRRRLGKRAYAFGRQRHNQAINKSDLWRTLFQARL